MKTRWLPPLCALFLSLAPTTAIRAQDTEPLPESGPPADLEQPDPFGETLPLIPEAPAASERPSFEPDDLPASSGVPRSIEPPKPSETRLAIEAQQRQVRMRLARIQAKRDPDLLAIYDGAEKAKTDAERRYAMHLYYDRLFARMLKLDPTLRQDDLQERKKTAVSLMNQDALRASVWTPPGETAR